LSSFAYKASRQAQLQRMLGDRGEVLPRVARGTAQHPAQGWYARLASGKLLYLGDHFPIACGTITSLNGKAP